MVERKNHSGQSSATLALRTRPAPRVSARFWAQVDMSAGPGGCWLWGGARLPNGYGRFGAGATESGYAYVYAHRFAFRDASGPLPDGLFVCHRCDNPPCVNPAHLFLGTHTDNMRDASKKGRNRRIPPEARLCKWCGRRTTGTKEVTTCKRCLGAARRNGREADGRPRRVMPEAMTAVPGCLAGTMVVYLRDEAGRLWLTTRDVTALLGYSTPRSFITAIGAPTVWRDVEPHTRVAALGRGTHGAVSRGRIFSDEAVRAIARHMIGARGAQARARLGLSSRGEPTHLAAGGMGPPGGRPAAPESPCKPGKATEAATSEDEQRAS
jgi:hypothetical protein